MKKVIIITGQTSTGKTKLALELAKKHNGEIINSDSRQIYKKLDIITGKDITDHDFQLDHKVDNFNIGFYCLQTIKLWLYDVVDPKNYFSSFDYKTCAIPVIEKILKEDKTPIIVGGTYFYLKHLLYGIKTENIPPNQKLRNELNNKPVQELQHVLKKINVQSFNRLNNSERNNPQRLIRKIEISTYVNQKTTMEPNRLRSEAGKPTRLIDKYDINFIGLRYKNKNDLRKAVKNRVKKRLKNGAIDEVKNILEQGYKESDPGLKTIGYKQIIEYLKGKLTQENAIEKWITAEMQYADRQYTFMKKDPYIVWQTL